ncbi:MAG: cupin [Firmicutes bacterium HGW-Firmicutes-16]|nr:MAG: cupin [Firmicutes bacterium HGW-Firmicutes-16]
MLKKINIKDEVESTGGLYIYKKVGVLNSHALSVVQVENRTLDFHVHELSDELFYVIEGSFQIETEDGLLRVDEGEFVIVPKGTKHRPVVGALAKFMMIELEGTLNKENSGNLYEE